MKFLKLTKTASVILACTATSQVMALAPDFIPPVGETVTEINISGASAQQKTIGAMLGAYCAAGTLDIYQDVGAAKNGKLWKTYFCTLKAGAANDVGIPGTLEGKHMKFNNRSKGGSIFGVEPVKEKWLVEFMNIKTSNCTLTTAAGVSPGKWDCTVANHATLAAGAPLVNGECPLEASNYGTATSLAGTVTVDNDTKCRRPEGGVSDVEPGLFSLSFNRPPTFPAAVGPGSFGRETAAFAVVFGLSVDHAVYTELQLREGLINTIGADGEACDGDFATSACRPSMTKAEVTAILGGGIKNWKTGFGLNSIAGGFGDMAICRRVNGSGTQAAANTYWMENPCRTGAFGGFQSMQTQPAVQAPGYLVIENSSSGGVIQCHNEMFAGTCADCGTFNYGSVGFNAIEKQPKATDKWAFIKINGIDPTVDNFLNGKYDYAFENTMQYSSGLGTDTGSDLATKAVMDMIYSNAPSPSFLEGAGTTGVAALCGLGFTPAPRVVGVSAPVTRATRGGNSCAALSVCP